MPTGVYKRKLVPLEVRKKIGLANKGKPNYWKGKKRSEETRKKMSLAQMGNKKGLGKKCSEEKKKKISLKNTGKKHTEEYKRQMSLNKIGKPNLSCVGDKNWNWKGGVTSENRKLRQSIEFKEWRKKVFNRDNYTDQKTGTRGAELHPHHILNFAEYPELRFDINNGITLSKESHIEFHNIYGKRNNTREQLEEFLNM